ncbi:hypothetical protein A6J33_018060 [Pantoea sp. FDAARGOS_194]|uniref:hypothetical protein n=1 Tax=Pantoea TaxID=53335 RepID=UPI00065FBDDA|nr:MULTISPECIES: hypothetical protein [Pantoea]PNK64550.1 hypothetical protein A6J33_018060 [Pantoea sp. FDAARGOS_194]
MAKVKWPRLPRFFVPLFNTANIYLARTRDEWVQAEKSLGVDAGSLSFALGRCRHYHNESTGENMYLIGVFDNNLSTLVHECAHATFYCCSDVGVTVKTDEPNETYCYLLDRMFSHFLPYIKQD